MCLSLSADTELTDLHLDNSAWKLTELTGYMTVIHKSNCLIVCADTKLVDQ